jgi:hypothetical protein
VRRRMGWQRFLLLAAFGFLWVPATARGQSAQTKSDAPPPREAPEAEMLKDLEFLRQMDLAKEREFLRMLHLLEKVPLLERFGLESPFRNPEQQ